MANWTNMKESCRFNLEKSRIQWVFLHSALALGSAEWASVHLPSSQPADLKQRLAMKKNLRTKGVSMCAKFTTSSVNDHIFPTIINTSIIYKCLKRLRYVGDAESVAWQERDKGMSQRVNWLQNSSSLICFFYNLSPEKRLHFLERLKKSKEILWACEQPRRI